MSEPAQCDGKYVWVAVKKATGELDWHGAVTEEDEKTSLVPEYEWRQFALQEVGGPETPMDKLYREFASLESSAVWGGSFEKEHGARMALKPVANKLFDEMLKFLAKRAGKTVSTVAHNTRAQ